MTTSILLCDDLPEEQMNMIRLLRHYEQARGLELDLETASDGAQMLAMWKPGRWDLIFLDIYMPQLNGIEAAQRLRRMDNECEIVFATTSREHGVEGYELRAMDYITKPISQQDVDEAMDWFFRQRAEKRSELLVRTLDGEKTIRAKDICYIETSAHTCLIHTPGDCVSIRRSLDELAADLNTAFFRCHKSFLVNFVHVVRIDKNAFLLDSGDTVPISAANLSRSKSALLAWKAGMH